MHQHYAPLITIRQILDHTDGFHEYAFDPGFGLLASSRLMPFDPQEVVDWGFERGPLFIPEPNTLQYGRPCYCRTRHLISNRETSP